MGSQDAIASARGQRHAILASPLRERTGFYLAVFCRGAQCGGEWSYAVTALGACYGEWVTIGGVPAPDAVRAGLWWSAFGLLAGHEGDA